MDVLIIKFHVSTANIDLLYHPLMTGNCKGEIELGLFIKALPM